MQKKALLLTPLLMSAAAAAVIAPRPAVREISTVRTATPRLTPVTLAHAAPVPTVQPASHIGQTLGQWHSLRQSDSLPFASYASFLARNRGWPGETSLRRSAERAIDPLTTAPRDVVAFFGRLPPLTATGHARYAFALAASGQAEAANAEARQAWREGTLDGNDENRIVAQFWAALTPPDHDQRMEALLDAGAITTARRTLALSSSVRRPIFETRLALQSRAPDATQKLALLGPAAGGDAGVLMDRANWLRNTGQSMAARALLAQPHMLTNRPSNVEKWYETLLTMARGAANDRQWALAYQIASQVDDAYAPGTVISKQPTGERDDYTSLVWLAGTTALHRLNRPTDAVAMFLRYARGGQSTQVLTKGLYWAGRAAQAASQNELAMAHYAEAARHPELFYGQLSLERIGRPVMAPAAMAALAPPTSAERTAYHSRDIVQAARLLGQLGRWEDQSLFVRALSENAENHRDRILAAEFSRQINRPDLAVWLARDARNGGTPFFALEAYPQVRLPPTQTYYWSLAHGIIRQESSFDRAAVSHAGARGMMQLMPGTARSTARKLSLSYELGRLTRDPDYNIMLGTYYFSELISEWGGSAPLAIASYNAGPGNVRRWIAENGDPRMPGYDIVRWIEDIPFSETRGYVQRVLENAVIYDTINPGQARTPAMTRLSSYLGKSNRPG